MNMQDLVQVYFITSIILAYMNINHGKPSEFNTYPLVSLRKEMGEQVEDGDDEDGAEDGYGEDEKEEEEGLKLIKKNFSRTKINSGVILHHF